MVIVARRRYHRDVARRANTLHFHKRHPSVGARPGTLVVSADSGPPRIDVISYSPDRVDERGDVAVSELGALIGNDHTAWINVLGLGDEKTLRDLAELFSLHPLVLEDVVNVPQRPKTEEYDGQKLVISRMVRLDAREELDVEQVSIIFGSNYVLTLQERHGDVLDAVRRRLRDGKGPMRRLGPDYLAYAILDAIIDAYYPVLEELGNYLEQLEDQVLTSPGADVLQRLSRVKATLLTLRRSIWPHREVANSLVRDDSPLVSETVRVYFRDVYDHCVQTAEVTEGYRDLVSSLMSTYLSAVSNRTNEIMKVLTIMASIFIPLTFLAGIYGMNFEYMPELHVRWAYPSLLGLMFVTVAGMLFFFWRKGWLGSGSETDEARDR